MLMVGATALLSGLLRNDDSSHSKSNNTQCAALLAHPSPTPVGIGSENHFEDKVESSDELELQTYTRWVTLRK